MLDEEHTRMEKDTNEEQVPARNGNDAFISVELNNETAQRWCLKEGRTCQIRVVPRLIQPFILPRSIK